MLQQRIVLTQQIMKLQRQNLNYAVDRAQHHVGALMKIIFWLAKNDIPLNVKLLNVLNYYQLLIQLLIKMMYLDVKCYLLF